MSQAEHALLQHIKDRLDHMLQFPELWGGAESLELQVLQLLEAYAVVRGPQTDRVQLFQDLQNAYRRFLSNIPPRSNRLLFQRKEMELSELVSLLSAFRVVWEAGMTEPNPYEVHDVVLSLQFDESVSLPPASMIGHYYETFRRAIRGIARPNQYGRTPKDLETATEFLTPELKIFPKNGLPGRVVLPLEMPRFRLQDIAAIPTWAAVRDAMSHMATVVEWANSSDDVEKIVAALPESEQRQRVASQTLRLIPGAHSSCNLVEFGGKAMGRLVPMQLRPGISPRLNEVVRYGRTADSLQLDGVVRKLDLDRGIIGVRPASGGRRVDLWITGEMEIEPTLLDATVHVSIDRYADALGRQTHFVNHLKVISYEPAASDEESEVTLGTKKN
jgi:hypothetical protein